MPAGDGTGPWGYGPMTGRGLGFCTGYNSPGFMRGWPRGSMRYGFGRGIGFGRGHSFGRGFGWRFFYNPYYTQPTYYYPEEPYHQLPNYPPYGKSTDIPPEKRKSDEKAYLEDVVEDLERELKAVKNRLHELSEEREETQ